MKRKIATLDVYVETGTVNKSSGTRKVSSSQYELVMTDGEIEGNPSAFSSRKMFQTVMAHELGHFVALVSGDPTHADDNQLMYQITGDTRSLIPAEKLAWKLAHVIYPDLDTNDEAHAMSTYESLAWGNWLPVHYWDENPVQETPENLLTAPVLVENPVWQWVPNIWNPFLAEVTAEANAEDWDAFKVDEMLRKIGQTEANHAFADPWNAYQFTSLSDRPPYLEETGDQDDDTPEPPLPPWYWFVSGGICLFLTLITCYVIIAASGVAK